MVTAANTDAVAIARELPEEQRHALAEPVLWPTDHAWMVDSAVVDDSVIHDLIKRGLIHDMRRGYRLTDLGLAVRDAIRQHPHQPDRPPSGSGWWSARINRLRRWLARAGERAAGGMPTPNDRLTVAGVKAIVIASVEYADEPAVTYTVLALMPKAPFYVIAQVFADGTVTLLETAESIVAAADLYQNWGGDY